MTRKSLAFLLISFLLIVFVALPAFGAKASKTATNNSTESRFLVPPVQPIADEGVQDFSSSKGTTSQGAALGYASPNAFAGYQMGITWYDYQHNGSMGRNIVRSPDNTIHIAWMYKPDGTTGSANRGVSYNTATPNGGGGYTFGFGTTEGSEVKAPPSGYTTLDLWGNKAVVGCHAGETEDTYTTYVFTDVTPGSGGFIEGSAPLDNCKDLSSYGSDNNYIWPVIDAEDDGTGTKTIIHAVSCETDNDHTLQSIVYNRALYPVAGQYQWRACEEGDPYTTGSLYIDSVADIAPVVREDPNSDKVAIVYSDPRVKDSHASQVDNDIVYIESTDKGVTWGAKRNITNYADNSTERAYTDLSAMYDLNGCLHIVWNTMRYDPASDNYYADQTKLFHWDDCDSCISLINAATNEPCDPGRWNLILTKPSISQCDTNLYVLYTWFTGSLDSVDQDCGPNDAYANGDLYVQASATYGLTWGPPINLTNTHAASGTCTAGSCESEMWPSMALYSTDSLYMLYVGDKDPGGWAGGGSGYEGTAQEDPMMFLPYPCFDMETYVNLIPSPARFRDPFHGAPSSTVDTSFTLQNPGNATASFTLAISYPGQSGWLNVTPTSGNVTAGCDNTTNFDLTVNAPATEGLYQAVITVTYDAAKSEVVIPVDFYCFDEFYTPLDDATIRTAHNEVRVSQSSDMARQKAGKEFSWFVDTTDYLFDASLLIGTDRDNMNFNCFHQVGDVAPPNNPWKELRALSVTYYDSTSYPYRYAWGLGCTGDSTIGFTSKFYASKHVDSAGFYVAHFDVYAGPKFTSPINGLTLGYCADWDIPSDTSSDNSPGLDSADQMIWLKGEYTGSTAQNDNRYGGLAYRGDDSTNMTAGGGFVWNNDNYVYPDEGFDVDSLEKYINMTASTPYFTVEIDTLPITDYSMLLVGQRGVSVNATDTFSFSVIVAATNPKQTKSETDLVNQIKKAEKFLCTYVVPDGPYCLSCSYGDADGNGIVNISDAVYLIAYIFGGGDPPDPQCNGDADCNGIVNISDAVYLIAYIFGGGDPPGCQ